MRISPYLSFNGQCEAAFKFYEKTLGGKIEFMMRYSESPMAKDMPKDYGQKVIHASFMVDNQQIAGADAFPGRFEKAQGTWVSLDFKEPAQADKVWKGLSEKAAKIPMPISETFWAKRFGMVVDQFGTQWMINCGKEQ